MGCEGTCGAGLGAHWRNRIAPVAHPRLCGLNLQHRENEFQTLLDNIGVVNDVNKVWIDQTLTFQWVRIVAKVRCQ